MSLTLMIPDEPELRARITVFGVGGAGGNAVNNMIEKELPGVEFIAANTDAQALGNSRAPRTLQLGTGVTRGLGAGSKPEVGLHAAEETMDEIAASLEGAHMCFITAGMGGGTGTGAAPVVARIAREMGILTVGVVTKPFHFEGARRMSLAEAGIEAMQEVVDTLIVIPNQNLFHVASERTTFVEAFQMADDVLYQGVQGVTDLMVRPGMINLDFADVRSVMEEMGKAMMGTGEAEGDTRATDAAEKAIANPLLDEVSLKGAKGVLINITGGYDLTLYEMDEAANRIKEEVDPNAMIKFGSAIDSALEGKMRVSVVATGIDAESAPARKPIDPEARRRPVETDPSMLAAVRGQRRPEAAEARPVEVRPVAEPEPVGASYSAGAVERDEGAGHRQAPGARPAQAGCAAGSRPAEPAPERHQPERHAAERHAADRYATERHMAERHAAERHAPEHRGQDYGASGYRGAERQDAPEPRPAERHMAERTIDALTAADYRRTARQPEPEAPQSPEIPHSEESRYATAPSPADIRARAEEVRNRAMAARQHREEDRRHEMAHDDEPALYDIDEASLDRSSARYHAEQMPMQARRVVGSDVFVDAPRSTPESAARASARSGLLTINKLIHRVAGTGTTEQREDRRQAPDLDEDGGDIPAFLRRQAN